VSIPENMDTMDDWRISTKRAAESMAISWERVSYIIHDILDMRKFSAK
jgi:hypothetical protein